MRHYAVRVATDVQGVGSEDAPPVSGEPAHFLQLMKQSVVYGTSGVLLQLVGVVTLPVFARVFTQAQYGLLELGITLSSLTIAIADFGFASAAQRSFYDYGDADAEERGRVLFTAIAFTTTISTVVAVALVVGRHMIADALFDGSHENLVLVVAAAIPLVNGANFLRETMRLRFRAWHYVISSVTSAVLSAVIAIVAVVWLDIGVEAIFLGVICGNALAVAYGLAVVHSDIRRRFSRPELHKMLVYGLPLVPTAIAGWALALLDRILLGRLSNLSEVGKYAVANRFSNVLLLVVTGFVLAFGPYVFSLYSRDRELEKVVRGKTLTYVTIVLALAGLCLALFAREVVGVIAPGFEEAYKAVGLLALGVVAIGISSVVMAGISISRRTIYFAVLAGIGVVLNVGLNLALIPPFGMVGAAAATAAAYALLAALHYRVSQRLYPTPYEPGRVLIIVALASGLGVLGLFTLGPLPLALTVKALAVAGFLVALRLTGVVEAHELARIRDLVGGRLRPARGRA